VPNFSSGPCAKRPGWSLQALTDAVLGRSHRSKIGKAKLKRAIDLSREVLQAPTDYRIGIVPASDTGAVEMAMWSLLGERGVDMVAWESFGEGWVTDAVKQLKLADVRTIKAPYGELPDLAVTAVFPAAALVCLPEHLRSAQAQYFIEWVETGRVTLHLVPEGMTLLVPAAPVMVFRLRTGDTAITSDHADGNFVYDESRHARVSGEMTAALAASLPHPLSVDILRKWT
jgi:hypothetical protein